MSTKKILGPEWMEKEHSNWGRWGKDDQVGMLNEVTPELIGKAFSFIKKNKVYDLEAPRFKGMDVWPGHSGWDILPYASPHGRQNMIKSDYAPAYNWYGKGGWLDREGNNKYNTGLNSETIIGPLHVGTHIDSFSHITGGEDNHWYNGYNCAEHWGDYGPLKADASNIPPIILPGVLLDFPGWAGVEHLEPHRPITPDDVDACCRWANVGIERGDCVLMRTGMVWPAMNQCPNCGPTLETVAYLVEEKGAFLLGDDQTAFENFTPEGSSFPGHAHPCHHYLLVQQGVHIMEMVMTNELARDKCSRFCFITLPTRIRGATGMMIRPVAIV
ncbi:MAG: cyclase family protein [Desulfovibrio sp.]|jgi:kynurenine formamidase|nr:cyclase family protein [Desulfovibrio sp.]